MKISRLLKPTPIGVSVTLVPLIDALTLTFLFVGLSGSFLFRPAVKLELPQFLPVQVAPAGLTSVTITGEAIFLNGRKVEKEGLEILLNLTAKLSEKKGREAAIVLRAGENVEHKQVLEIIGIAWRSGIKKVSVATKE